MTIETEKQQANESNENYGSVEKALAGDYQLSIRAVISEAWDKTLGAKGTLFLIFVIGFGINALLVIVETIINSVLPISTLFKISVELIDIAVNAQLWTAFIIIGLRRAVSAPIEVRQLFCFSRYTIPLLVLNVLIIVLVMMGFVLLILPGIYLSFAYILAFPLIVDKNMGIWEALETSRKAITKRWFTVFGLMLVMALIILAAMIPVGIGLIWAVPLFSITYGILYRNIFGCSEQTASEELLL